MRDQQIQRRARAPRQTAKKPPQHLRLDAANKRRDISSRNDAESLIVGANCANKWLVGGEGANQNCISNTRQSCVYSLRS